MKEYPHILRAAGMNFMEYQAYVFDKLDGSNLRFEWSKKQGWHKFGTRTQMFDQTNKVFGPAIPIFKDMLGAQLEEIAVNNRWQRIIAFCEYVGPNSFAGWHDPNDQMDLTLFDVNVHQRGILGPKEFLKHFKYLKTPNFLGIQNWTRGFVQRVYNGEVDGITFEGVVGKAGEGHQLQMAKAKTKAWLDRIHAKFTPEEAEKLINS